LRLPPIGKAVLSWLMLVLGALCGFYALAVFGIDYAPFGDRDPGWFLRWFSIVGTGLAGGAFIAGSLLALRNRRSAGRIFLTVMPVVAYLLADPDAGFLVWHSDGGGYWETPLPLTGIGLTVLFFAPFLLLFLARRHKKRAAYLFGLAAVVAIIVFSRSRWTSVLLPRLAVCSAPFLAFGLFWVGTHRLGWPTLLSRRPQSFGQRVAAIVFVCCVILFADIAVTLGISALHSSLWSPDCGGRSLFVHSLFPGHSVFTARIVLTGPSIQVLKNVSRMDPQASDVLGLHVGDWAIAAVQKRFWGVPWPPFVLLTNGIYWKGEKYFIDGRRTHGLLTEFLPVVEAGPCSRSKPLVDAELELRVLQEGPPAKGVRIIGYATSPGPARDVLQRPKARPPLPGAHVLVTGPSGTAVVTTDENGVYEIDGAPPGDYRLKLELPDTEDAPEQDIRMQEMARLSTVERDFWVAWNGTVEGTVRDNTGKPATVELALQGLNGTNLAPSINPFAGTKADGSFQIKRIPPGKYILAVNPYGPGHESPYAPLFYPSVLQAQGARVFELTQGQHLKNINFSVQRLAERKLPIRFTTADGQPVKDPWFWILYERSWYYYDQNPRAGGGILKTDNDGRAEISVFGDQLRFWVYAEVFPANDVLSPPTGLRGESLPARLDLKLNLSESQFTEIWHGITGAPRQRR
jgi:hypothetical protein